jgi:hypothetical protein
VHDSRGVPARILAGLRHGRAPLPHATIAGRMDAAVFSDEIVQPLSDPALEFTLSGPFERVPKLKPKIEARPYGCQIRREQSGFDELWKPGSRPRRHCFAFIGQHRALQRQGPIQLDRVEPNETPYDDKLVVRNKPTQMKHVLQFHEGRGQQANRFGQRSSQCPMQHGPRGSG